MRATEILMDEHQVILRVLDALEKAAAVIPTNKVTPAFFLDAADFIKNFADGCHHAKEEGVLFKYMEAHGVTVQGGPIGVMLSDHEAGRQFTRQMKAAAEKWQAGDASAAAVVKTNAEGYISLLRAHIMKENNVLFPMADRVIPLDVQPEVEEKFEFVEHEETGDGVHEKYLALAEKMEHDAAAF
jgi:hemerythrin-like domain-containing protein